jgi:hypothetical protein
MGPTGQPGYVQHNTTIPVWHTMQKSGGIDSSSRSRSRSVIYIVYLSIP